MVKLTYRGVNYKTNPGTIESQDTKTSKKYNLSYDRESEKIVWVRKIQYYTYRGVSYTKYTVVNAKSQLS